MKNFTAMTITLAASLLILGACDKKDAASGAPASASEANNHAAATVVPGSYEDWCGEHAVPESQCTKCNPKLVAAFKATGDWCKEHGLPESQCLQCNPGVKIQRPPKPEGTK